MIYKYRAITQTGEIIEGLFEGQDESHVILMLKENKYLPIEIKENGTPKAEIDIFFSKVKKKDLAIFCRQFYTMIDAGIGIVNCIEILEKQSENKLLIKTLRYLYEDVQKGCTISEGMKKHTKIFPLLLINMIEAGEISGNLDIIMERMAVHFEKEYKLENKIKSTLIYPIVLMVVSISVVIFLLVAVMPTFIGMFEESGQSLPKVTQILLNMSNCLIDFWYIFIFSIVGSIVIINIFKQTLKGKFFFDTLKINLPMIKNTNIKIITGRFTRTLSILMSSGIPLLNSMDIVGKIVGNKVIEDRLVIAVEDIKNGTSLSRTIEEMQIFPPMVESMIKIGEESGAIDYILYKTADFYDDEVEVSLQRMTSLMEPIMLVLMAIVIGFIVIAMAMPMFDLVNTI